MRQAAMILGLLLPLPPGCAALPCFMDAWGGSGDDIGRAAAVTPAGYMIAGERQTDGVRLTQAWLLELSNAGDSTGSSLHGGAGEEHCMDILRDGDGGWALAGSVETPSGDHDLWVLRLDSALDTLWQATLTAPGHDAGYAVIAHPDGGLAVAGSRDVDGATGRSWLLRFDEAGDTLWSRTSPPGPLRLFHDLIDTGDGMAAAGLAYDSTGDCGFLLSRFDYGGTSLWEKTYGGPGWEVCYGLSIRGDTYCLGGYTTSFGSGDGDFWYLEADGNGDSLASSVYGGGEWERCYDIAADDDGSLLCGYTASLAGPGDISDCWLVRTGPGGALEWSVSYGGTGSDRLYAVETCTDGGYLLAGESDGQLLALRVDSLGQLGQSGVGRCDGDGRAPSLQPAANPVLATDVVSFEADPGGPGTLSLFDPAGRLVRTVPVAGPGLVSVSPGGPDAPSGVYLAVLRAGDSTASTSVVVIGASSR